MDIHSFNKELPILEPGKVYLGLVEVTLNRIYIFGTQQQLSHMVSFIPGMGNGAYEIYGTVKDIPGYGYRITKIEIEFVTDEEILHYAKQHSDCLEVPI